MSVILGLNAYHADSAACLILDGRLVAAAEEERFRRIKHWAGLPTKAIDYCLSEARLNIADVEHIAINRKPGVNNLRRLGFVVTRWPSPRLILEKVRNIRSAVSVKETLEKAYNVSLKAELHQVEHHLAHLASAFLVSDFEEAACISVDGFGDFASTAFGFGSGHEVTISRRVYFPHSLGIFYSALTQYLGFPHYGDEYKVMGLAPYGESNLLEPLREVVKIQSDGTFRLNLEFFRHHSDNVSYTWNDCTPSVGLLYKSTLIDLLGPARQPNEPLEQKHKDLARSVQVTYERAFLELLQTLHKEHPSTNLALSGGCAMNSVANGKVYRRTPFTKMYLPAAAGDAGGAIGAAAWVNSQLARDGKDRPFARQIPADVNVHRQTDNVTAAGAVASEVGGNGNLSELEENVQRSTSNTQRSTEEHSPPTKRGPFRPALDSRVQVGATLAQVDEEKSEAVPSGKEETVRSDDSEEFEENISDLGSLPGDDGGPHLATNIERPTQEVGAIDLNRLSPDPKDEENASRLTTDIERPTEEAATPPALESRELVAEAVLSTINPPPSAAAPIPSVPLRPLNSAYLGPESTEMEIHALIDWRKKDIGFAGCVTQYFAAEEDLTKHVAQAIDDGKVVGWFQGRMEWGPRALGNRSILADPRRADMKDILNSKIKRRESFRPFAPSILREAVSEWFEQDDDVPFMMEVFQIRAQKRSFIPAVTHVDGSGRLQTVHKETNPRYYRLIEQFKELTGIPMVLNTSFNENEPVVCYPEEALECFLRTKMDLLVLGNFCVERTG